MSDEEDVSLASDQDQIDDQLNDEDAGGLFGSGSEDEQSGYEALLSYDESKLTDLSTDSVSNKRRKLNDAALDSGDDDGRLDRVKDGINGYRKEEETYDRLANILDISIGRHPVPQPSDGEVRLIQAWSTKG